MRDKLYLKINFTQISLHNLKSFQVFIIYSTYEHYWVCPIPHNYIAQSAGAVEYTNCTSAEG